jgi:valyl-tRNA synthetase
MHNNPLFRRDEQPGKRKEDVHSLIDEMLEMRNLLSQQLQQQNIQGDLNAQVELQKKELQETNIVLQRLVKTLNLYKVPDYELTLEALEQRLRNLDDTNRQLIKIVSRIDLSGELSRIEKDMETLNNNFKIVRETLEDQQKLLKTNFDWKVLAAQVVVMSIVTTTMIVLSLRLFPPNPLVDKELQVIYNKVEQIRKAKK